MSSIDQNIWPVFIKNVSHPDRWGRSHREGTVIVRLMQVSLTSARAFIPAIDVVICKPPLRSFTSCRPDLPVYPRLTCPVVSQGLGNQSVKRMVSVIVTSFSLSTILTVTESFIGHLAHHLANLRSYEQPDSDKPIISMTTAPIMYAHVRGDSFNIQ
mgnify:CR=1 FL=1